MLRTAGCDQHLTSSFHSSEIKGLFLSHSLLEAKSVISVGIPMEQMEQLMPPEIQAELLSPAL